MLLFSSSVCIIIPVLLERDFVWSPEETQLCLGQFVKHRVFKRRVALYSQWLSKEHRLFLEINSS